MLDAATTPVTVRRQGLPDEMRLLVEAYPRDSWAAHPGFREKTRQWLGAHRMFRHMAERVRRDAEKYLDAQLAPEDYALSWPLFPWTSICRRTTEDGCFRDA